MSTLTIILYLAAILTIGFAIGIVIGKLRYGKGDKMFSGHKHNWQYMYSTNASWDWFFCNECLAECCQTVNVDTGVVERHIFNPAIKKK